MKKDLDFPRRTIYLLNPISGHGHLDSWVRIFTAAFLELGHRVILFSPQFIGVTRWLEQRNLVPGDRLRLAKACTAPEKPGSSPEKPGSIRKRLAKVYRNEGLAGIGCKIINRFSNFFQIKLVDPNYISPLAFIHAIKNCIAETQWHPDFIFILYLDMLSRKVQLWNIWEDELPYFWGGIQFSPTTNTINPKRSLDTWFTRPYFRGTCFLLDEASSYYRYLLPKKIFATIPDVTDAEQLDSPSPLMDQVREMAAGRTIVFAGGSLDVRKGLSALARVILRAPASEFFFLVVGRLYWETFDAETATLLRSLFENPPDNVLAHLQFVEDEREFNSLMALADIIYAVYNNFPYSSNMLSKAAHLERPLIVSDGYEMGRRVKQYGLGIAVSESDTDAILKALSALRQKKISVTNFATYRRDNSFEVLTSILQEFLTAV